MMIERTRIRRRRSVERELARCRAARLVDLLVVLAHRDDGEAGNGDLADVPSSRFGAGRHGRERDIGHELGGVEGMHEKPVRRRTDYLDHAGTHASYVDRRWLHADRSGIEERRHERMGVELAAVVEPLAGLEGVPDRPNRLDVLTHSLGGA